MIIHIYFYIYNLYNNNDIYFLLSGTIAGTVKLLSNPSAGMGIGDKISLNSTTSYEIRYTGTFNVNISKGSYTISIINGKDGESGSNNFDMSSGLWCKGQAGTSGQPSSITYQNQKYTAGNTSMNIINNSTITVVVGEGGQGGDSRLENGGSSGNCYSGSDGANGRISIIPN